MTAKTFEPLLNVLGGNAQASVCQPEQFARWLAKAKPNDRIRYAQARWLPKEAAAPVLRLLRAAHDDGEILFLQERLAEGRYDYFAVRKHHQVRPAPTARFVARGLRGERA